MQDIKKMSTKDLKDLISAKEIFLQSVDQGSEIALRVESELKSLYREISKEDRETEHEVERLRRKCDELGVEYNKRAGIAKLTELIEVAEKAALQASHPIVSDDDFIDASDEAKGGEDTASNETENAENDEEQGNG